VVGMRGIVQGHEHVYIQQIFYSTFLARLAYSRDDMPDLGEDVSTASPVTGLISMPTGRRALGLARLARRTDFLARGLVNVLMPAKQLD
jgi:hypothetical protein